MLEFELSIKINFDFEKSKFKIMGFGSMNHVINNIIEKLNHTKMNIYVCFVLFCFVLF